MHEIIFLKYSHPGGCWVVAWRLSRNKEKRARNKTMRPGKQIERRSTYLDVVKRALLSEHILYLSSNSFIRPSFSRVSIWLVKVLQKQHQQKKKATRGSPPARPASRDNYILFVSTDGLLCVPLVWKKPRV